MPCGLGRRSCMPQRQINEQIIRTHVFRNAPGEAARVGGSGTIFVMYYQTRCVLGASPV